MYWLTPTSPQCPSSRPASVPPTACPRLTHFNSLSSFPLHILLTAELSTSLRVHYSHSHSTHSPAQCRQRKMRTGVPHRRMHPSYACAAPRWQAQNKLHVVRSTSCRLTRQTSLVSVASIFSARPPSTAAASSPQILVPLLQASSPQVLAPLLQASSPQVLAPLLQASSPQVLAPLLLHLLHKSLLYCSKHLLHKSLLHCCCIFSTGPCSVAAASSPQVLAPLLQASSLQDLPARPPSKTCQSQKSTPPAHTHLRGYSDRCTSSSLKDFLPFTFFLPLTTGKASIPLHSPPPPNPPPPLPPPSTLPPIPAFYSKHYFFWRIWPKHD